eukprot:188945_1
MGRKEFGMALAKIKIKTGRSGKLFKHLKCKLGNKEMNDAIRANNLQSYSRGSRDNIAYEQYIVFGYIRRQQNIFDVIYNDVFHNIPMDIAFICALYYHPIELNELAVDEMNVLLCQIIINDNKLNNAKMDINEIKKITIKEDLNGVKFKAMKRKHFGKLYRPCGMKGGQASKIFQKLSRIQTDEISLYLQKQVRQQKKNNVKQKTNENNKHINKLATLNVEQFSDLFISVLKSMDTIRDIYKTSDKLEQCKNIIIDNNIDGNKCKDTRSLKFAKLFRETGIKIGPLAMVHKTVIKYYNRLSISNIK